MKYIVNPWNNFCRVFEIPEEFPTDFCFGGGHPVNFQMVDWFNPTRLSQAGVSKEEWAKKVGPVEDQDVEIDHETIKADLLPFLRKKMYVKPGRKYLLMSDFGMMFIFP